MVTGYYDGARAKEYRRAMLTRQPPSDLVPALADLLEAHRQAEHLQLSAYERQELRRAIKDRLFGTGRGMVQWDGEADVMDAEVVDDDSGIAAQEA